MSFSPLSQSVTLTVSGTNTLHDETVEITLERAELVRAGAALAEADATTPRIGSPMTLSQAARNWRMVWIFCLRCGHAARMDPAQLALRLGEDMAIGAPVARFLCQRCGGKMAVTMLDPRPKPHDDRTHRK